MRLLLTIMLVALSGCGGTSTGTSDDSPTTATPSPVPEHDGAASIRPPAGFEFATSQTLPIEIEVAASEPSGLYLTVCRATDHLTSDYRRCLMKTRMDDTQLTRSIEVPNDVDRLVVALWRMQPTQRVAEHVWNRERDGLVTFRVRH
ncbi:MAG: hypothetical protein AAFN07_03610 [Pseudomonadota bacterium]